MGGLPRAIFAERLLEVGDPVRQLDGLEQVLAARLPQVQEVHPAVAMALHRFRMVSAVAPVVEESGYSHRVHRDVPPHDGHDARSGICA